MIQYARFGLYHVDLGVLTRIWVASANDISWGNLRVLCNATLDWWLTRSKIWLMLPNQYRRHCLLKTLILLVARRNCTKRLTIHSRLVLNLWWLVLPLLRHACWLLMIVLHHHHWLLLSLIDKGWRLVEHHLIWCSRHLNIRQLTRRHNKMLWIDYHLHTRRILLTLQQYIVHRLGLLSIGWNLLLIVHSLKRELLLQLRDMRVQLSLMLRWLWQALRRYVLQRHLLHVLHDVGLRQWSHWRLLDLLYSWRLWLLGWGKRCWVSRVAALFDLSDTLFSVLQLKYVGMLVREIPIEIPYSIVWNYLDLIFDQGWRLEKLL